MKTWLKFGFLYFLFALVLIPIGLRSPVTEPKDLNIPQDQSSEPDIEEFFNTNYTINFIIGITNEDQFHCQAEISFNLENIEGMYNFSLNYQLEVNTQNASIDWIYDLDWELWLPLSFPYQFNHLITIKLYHPEIIDLIYCSFNNINLTSETKIYSQTQSILCLKKPVGLYFGLSFSSVEGYHTHTLSWTQFHYLTFGSNLQPTQYWDSNILWVPNLHNFSLLTRFHFNWGQIELNITGGSSYFWNLGEEWANVSKDFFYEIITNKNSIIEPNFTICQAWGTGVDFLEGSTVSGGPYAFNYNSSTLFQNPNLKVQFHENKSFRVNTHPQLNLSDSKSWKFFLTNCVEFNFEDPNLYISFKPDIKEIVLEEDEKDEEEESKGNITSFSLWEMFGLMIISVGIATFKNKHTYDNRKQ